ncbi:MAG TPA: MOP flippase family protein [Gaiellaceae bacterium]|jgi:O-antigen/teichoic acid export membrane protein
MRTRVLRGLAWKVLSQVFGQTWQTVVAIILARLLFPADYGLAAMVLVFAAIVPIFSDLALGAALVQRRTLSESDRSTVFWTSTGVGVLFTVLGIALSWPMAAFYGEPEVQPLFAVLSLSFVITALGTTQKALLTRDMDFRSLELRLMAGSFAAGVVGILLAAGGYGAWAIIGQQVVLAVVSTALLWSFTRWRPRFRFSLDSLRGLVGFSLNVFGTRLLFYGNRNADNLLIGRFVGASGLGVYSLAYNVMLAPMSRLGWPIAEVLFPAFSKMQDEPGRMASAWVRVNRLVGSLTIPASLGVILVAPEFVTAVLGDRWSEAIPIIRLLGWVSLLQSLGTLDSAVLLARNRSGTLLRYAVVAFVASVAAFVVGLEWGVVGVAVGYALVSTFLEPYYAWLTARSLDVSVLVLLRALAGVAQASAAMACAVLAAKLFLLPADLASGWSLVVLILVGIAVYVPLCAWRAPEVVEEVRDVVRSRTSAPAPRAEAQPTTSS